MKSLLRNKYGELTAGFFLDGEFPSRQHLAASSDPWEQLFDTLLSCQEGDFSTLARIPPLMLAYSDWQFWMASVQLMGYAGSRPFLEQLFEDFSHRHNDIGGQNFLAVVLGNAGGLWAVEPLLALHRLAEDEDPRYEIEVQLSYLLEPSDNVIWCGADEDTRPVDDESLDVYTIVDHDGYAELVRTLRDELQALHGDQAICHGRVVDVPAICRRVYDELRAEKWSKNRIGYRTALIEAYLGVDCKAFFDSSGGLRPLAGGAVLEEILDDPPQVLEPGRRYFFGHLVE